MGDLKKKVIYCIPGLGQDDRVFSDLEIKNAELRFLNWEAAQAKEDIPAYAARLAKRIDPDEKELYLLGVSLGGIMAVELAKILKVKKIILISTVKNRDELPASFHWLGKVPVTSNSIPKFIIDAQVVLKPFYGKANSAGVDLFEEMLHDASLDFLRWAWNQIPKWKNEEKVNAPFIHLHGTSDLIFPIKNIDCAITLKGATHFAIFNDKKKLNQLIELYF